MPWVAAASLVVAAATATMQLHSPDFSPGGVIPQRAMAADCGGENRSPELKWSAVPEGVKSFALILHDPDAPLAGGFYHWVVYNIPADARRLAGGATLTSGQLGTSTRGTAGYYGPCPPPGPVHHYVFTLYALDLPHVAASSPMTASLLEARLAGHVLARAVLTGTESHH
jgi:Raf kinase inhibitor-like YbhB/YbcL family protein